MNKVEKFLAHLANPYRPQAQPNGSGIILDRMEIPVKDEIRLDFEESFPLSEFYSEGKKVYLDIATIPGEESWSILIYMIPEGSELPEKCYDCFFCGSVTHSKRRYFLFGKEV